MIGSRPMRGIIFHHSDELPSAQARGMAWRSAGALDQRSEILYREQPCIPRSSTGSTEGSKPMNTIETVAGVVKGKVTERSWPEVVAGEDPRAKKPRYWFIYKMKWGKFYNQKVPVTTKCFRSLWHGLTMHKERQFCLFSAWYSS